MSLLSRLFRKVPSPAAPGAQPTPTEAPAKARPRPNAAERALIDDAEAKALRSAIDAGDSQTVARLVVAGASTRIRQAAAQAIEDPEVLRQLIHDTRGGNDKNVYRILTGKRDVLHEQTRKQEKLRAEIDAAATDLERLSLRSYDALFSLRLEQSERRWNAVAEQADPELRSRVQQWIRCAHETNDGHLREVAALAALEQAAAQAAAEAVRLREEQAQASAAAAAEQARILEEQARLISEQQQAERHAEHEIGELIRKARGALNGGNTARAAALRRAIEAQTAAVPPLSIKLGNQLQQLDKQLEELKDWKRFSVTPKRAELIESIEALIDAPFEPPALADKIKNLQEEWRTLGKGAGENLEADEQRFHEAARKAYQPCSEYFAAQALVREENLRRREALLGELTAFETAHNWEQPDWRAVIAFLRKTKQQWRALSPVEHRAGKLQQEQFSAAIASLQARLEAEYDRNVKEKASLVERARQLLASEDVHKAINAVKQLQRQWQSVGPLPRDADQRLWREFRQCCDAVFQKREQAAAAYAAELENNKAQAIAVCEQLEQIAALEGAELLARAGSLAELRNAFEALGEFPRAESRELRSRLEQALDRCKKALARQHARDAEHGWDVLFDAANQVRAYRLALARGAEQAQLEHFKATAEACLASSSRWPKGGLDALKRGLAEKSATDLAAHERALRTLCIRAEILADVPTPPEDQPLRREYQLQRLAQSMGQGRRADEAQMDDLVIEWVSAGPVEDATYERLLQRFRRCRERSGPKG